MSDDTYLESFVETLTTLPHSVRRDLDLMKDLDRSYTRKSEELKRLHRQYIQKVEETVMGLEIVKDENTQQAGLRTIGGDHVIVPTTQELFQYTHDPEMYSRIEQLQKDCLQLADEKVSIAKQIHKAIDGTVQRLDRDLENMESTLQANGEYYVEVTAQANELVACQANPGDEWILAKVISYDDNSGMYKLADEDAESGKVFDVPEQQVSLLTNVEKLRTGDTIFAVYPDTTSFYQGTVVQAARRQGGAQAYVMVSFQDDADEFGQTHDKAIRYAMFPPYGSDLQ